MRERVFLVGLRRPREQRTEAAASFAELARLVDTAGGSVVGAQLYEVRRWHPATLLGSGQVAALAQTVSDVGAETIAVDVELTPAQNRNLNAAWGVKVVDRTAVILDIFARRAHSKEGKLQVELAQLQYRLPRLAGKGPSLSQQAGYIGNRGPGETKLEIDRRRVRERLTGLRRALELVRRRRAAARAERLRRAMPVVAIVGYTNAGKSTLLNRLTTAGVLVEDQLFATLDPVVRRLQLPSGREVLLTDTVGFIRRLPHQLVEAFQATFEEIAAADLVLHLVDASSVELPEQLAVAESVLAELFLHQIPRLTVYNKCDRLAAAQELYIPPGAPRISALTGAGLADLLQRLDQLCGQSLQTARFRLPHHAGAVLAMLYRCGHVLRIRHLARAVVVDAAVPAPVVNQYARYVVQ